MTTALRLDALDGLRGVAVVVVLAYHAHYPWAHGGFLGVDMFFVLSGFLITRGLVRLARTPIRRAPLVYLHFLARRAGRLVPTLAFALGCGYVLTVATGSVDARAHLGRCTLAAGTYWMNLPAAERLRCPAIWHVTWSLAAEEQFYIVWPIVLAGICAVARGRRRGRALAWAALAVYGIGTGWHLVLSVAGATSSRVLFAPDGRSLVILVGCALAALPAQPRCLTVGSGQRLAAVGVVALAADLAVASPSPGFGLLAALVVAASGTASVIAGTLTCGQGGVAFRALSGRGITAIGRMSYSLYVVHELAYRAADLVTVRGTVAYELVRWPVCAVVAGVSYRLIEQPCRRRIYRLLDHGSTSQRKNGEPSA